MLGDNIVVIWPSFVSPTTPISYDIFTGNLFVSSTSSIQERTRAESLLIYPNPIIEKATIKTVDFSKIENFRILDIAGKTIKEMKIKGEQYVVFHKKDIPNGIYFIEITSKDKKYLQKIIIH